MRCRDLIVVAVMASSLLSCRGEGEREAAVEGPGHGPTVELPAELQGTPWGEIVTLKTELWSLFQGDTDDPDGLVEVLDDWYGRHKDPLKAACLEVSRRTIEAPDDWKPQQDAFSLWQIDVARPRTEALEKILRDPRLIERLHLFDERCLDAASCAGPTNRGRPENPWGRYVFLRKEIHTLIDKGLSRAEETLRTGAAWYSDHEAEISATCRRMAELSNGPENEEYIAEYTAYLRTAGQSTMERLIARIPLLVPTPGTAKGMFELLNRFDRICADATPSGH